MSICLQFRGQIPFLQTRCHASRSQPLASISGCLVESKVSETALRYARDNGLCALMNRYRLSTAWVELSCHRVTISWVHSRKASSHAACLYTKSWSGPGAACLLFSTARDRICLLPWGRGGQSAPRFVSRETYLALHAISMVLFSSWSFVLL